MTSLTAGVSAHNLSISNHQSSTQTHHRRHSEATSLGTFPHKQTHTQKQTHIHHKISNTSGHKHSNSHNQPRSITPPSPIRSAVTSLNTSAHNPFQNHLQQQPQQQQHQQHHQRHSTGNPFEHSYASPTPATPKRKMNAVLAQRTFHTPQVSSSAATTAPQSAHGRMMAGPHNMHQPQMQSPNPTRYHLAPPLTMSPAVRHSHHQRTSIPLLDSTSRSEHNRRSVMADTQSQSLHNVRHTPSRSKRPIKTPTATPIRSSSLKKPVISVPALPLLPVTSAHNNNSSSNSNNSNSNNSNSNNNATTSKPRHKGKTNSLVGFDPFLDMGNMSMSSLQSEQQTPQPVTNTRTTTKHHRKGVQSFCMSDLRSISQDAMDQEVKEGRVADSRTAPKTATIAEKKTTSPVNANKTLLSASSHSTDSNASASKKTKKTKTKKRDVSPPLKGKLSAAFSRQSKKTPAEKRGASTSPSPPSTSARSSIKSWMKKGHRRTQSLESKDAPASAASAKAAQASDANVTMYPTVIKDLMGLKMEKSPVSTLAKPLPTSFLTGKEDEVVRTCEAQPDPHQIDIPALPECINAAHLIEFVDNYRRIDQNFDLSQWKGRSQMELNNDVRIREHKPILQSLMECGDVTVQHVIAKGQNCDEQLEACIFEGQRHFTVVFRGTTEQQTKLGKKSAKCGFLPLDSEHENAQIFATFKEEYTKIEAECFTLLDALTEENPFCDIVFTGHSFGAALATIAAFKYSNARPMVRVSCLTLASPKVGSVAFRHAVNSQPNLKVMRLEYGQDGKCQAPAHVGVHVGHTLVLHGSIGSNSVKTSCPIVAYKFDTPKHKKFKTNYPDLRSYVHALEEVQRLRLTWARDFVGASGKGVVVNNEKRLVV